MIVVVVVVIIWVLKRREVVGFSDFKYSVWFVFVGSVFVD